MKATIYLILITGIFGISGFAQTSKPKTEALPAGITNWSGEDSSRILNDTAIKLRLKKMLGKTSYASFIESFETVTPITKTGNVLFASGCLIHACTHLESAIAIDLGDNTIHAAIYNDEKTTRFFNERRTRSPKPMISWAKSLNDLQGNKR